MSRSRDSVMLVLPVCSAFANVLMVLNGGMAFPPFCRWLASLLPGVPRFAYLLFTVHCPLLTHRLLPPAHLVDAHGVLEAAQDGLALIGEQEALARRQLSHHVRGQYLSRLCEIADAGGELDGGAEQVLLLSDRLPGVQTDAHGDLFDGRLAVTLRCRCAVPLNDRPLDGDGALQRPRGGGEGGHDTVAGVLDLPAAVGLQGIA